MTKSERELLMTAFAKPIKEIAIHPCDEAFEFRFMDGSTVAIKARACNDETAYMEVVELI